MTGLRKNNTCGWSMLLTVLFLLVAIFSTVVQEAEAKRVTGTVSVMSNKVSKIAKFSFRPVGNSIVKGKFKYRGKEPRGSVYLFMDTEWDNYHSTSDDCTRMSKASARINIGTNVVQGKGWFNQQETKEVGPDTYEFSFTWTIEHRVRTYGYYLVVADCLTGGSKRFKHMEYDVSFLNDDTDHFPSDEHGLFTLYILCFLGLAAFAAQQYRSVKENGRSNALSNSFFASFTDGPPKAATTLLIFGYAAETLSILFEILHLWWYGYNGMGLFAFDFASEVLEGIAQTTLAYLLLAFAGGWTLVEGTFSSKKDGAINPDALGEDHPSTVFLALMTIITFILQLLNKLILFDEFTKFHDHDSWPGFILVLVRTALAGFFTYQISQTIKYMSNRKAGKSHTLSFMQNLALFGGLWFWVFPVLVFVSGIFAHYLRHRIVAGGVLFLQTGCLIFLTKQIFQESSAYSKASLHRGVILGGNGH